MKYIRAYDFESRVDFYLEGIVVREEGDRYVCVMMKQVEDGEVKDVVLGDWFKTPKQDTLWFDWDDRVIEIPNPSWKNTVGVAIQAYLDTEQEELSQLG